MAETGQTLAERRAAVAAATAALRSLPRVLSLVSDEGLAGMAAELSELRALAGSAIVATLAEAEQRGVVAESQCASARGWIADAAWHSRREAGSIANAAAVLALPDLAPVSEALLSGDVDIPTAVAIAAEFSALASDLRADALPLVLDQFIEIGATHGPAGVHQLTETLLARYGGEGTFEDHADRCRRHIHLSAARDSAAGLWDYRLTVDNEGHAVVEAVIGPLSAPKPDPNGGDSDIGDRDTRSVGQRRGEALIAALRRSVSAAAHVPTSPKAILTVTVGVDELRRQIGTGVVAGTLAAGTTLPPTPFASSRATPGSFPPCWAATASSSTTAARSGSSLLRRFGSFGSATTAARSTAAMPRRPGAMRTTSCTGSMAARPTRTTERCYAAATTPSSTATGSPGGWSTGASYGICGRARTVRPALSDLLLLARAWMRRQGRILLLARARVGRELPALPPA